MLGNLTLDALPLDQPVIMGAFGFMGLSALSVVAMLTYLGRWKWLWTEWLTSVDHKKIGVMYIILALVMLLRGFSDAIMMRMQLALAHGGAAGYLPPEHYDQIFSAHGAIMIFFMAMPFVIGLINIVVPLQIGARGGSPTRRSRNSITARGSVSIITSGACRSPGSGPRCRE